MDWIALQPRSDDAVLAWSWQGLRFTPRVARVDEALVLEVSASWRLFGGPEALLQTLLAPEPPLAPLPATHWARGPTSGVALALLRLKAVGRPPPSRVPDDLPLPLLTAATPHADMLARTGCHTWGALRTLPRGPVARRFGAALLDALDAAWGLRPERYSWLTLPEVFEAGVDLPALASTAPELLDAASHLLGQLQLWLRARHQGVRAFELQWALDLRRLDGVALPTHQTLTVRTAQAVQAMDHLRRLTGEQLARTTLAAPANHLRLRSLETEPWIGANRGFLLEDAVEGERLHQLVERLSARLGADQICVPVPQADWRPERMQRWEPAVHHLDATDRAQAASQSSAPLAHGLYPPWLLPQPLRLQVRGHRPWYEGPLHLLTRRQRIETGWWETSGTVVRDYRIARSERAGLLWVYCENGPDPAAPARWYLQGLYA
jgi:protein ImuB